MIFTNASGAPCGAKKQSGNLNLLSLRSIKIPQAESLFTFEKRLSAVFGNENFIFSL